MPNCYCSPGCKVGYKPQKKKLKKDDKEVATDESHALFRFLPERRAKWVARVPRDNWNPNDNTNLFLCDKHFMPSDILIERNILIDYLN